MNIALRREKCKLGKVQLRYTTPTEPATATRKCRLGGSIHAIEKRTTEETTHAPVPAIPHRSRGAGDPPQHRQHRPTLRRHRHDAAFGGETRLFHRRQTAEAGR